jgi:hypothetical protein
VDEAMRALAPTSRWRRFSMSNSPGSTVLLDF